MSRLKLTVHNKHTQAFCETLIWAVTITTGAHIAITTPILRVPKSQDERLNIKREGTSASL